MPIWPRWHPTAMWQLLDSTSATRSKSGSLSISLTNAASQPGGLPRNQSQQKWAYGHSLQVHMTRHDAGLAVRTILQGQLFATRRQSLGSMLAVMQKTEPWVHVRSDAEDIPRSHPRLHTLTYYLTQRVQGVICHDHEPERPWSMAALHATGLQCAQVACAAAHSFTDAKLACPSCAPLRQGRGVAERHGGLRNNFRIEPGGGPQGL